MIFAFLAVLLVFVSSKSLPPDIKKCSKSDPNLGKCLDTTVVDAVHKLSAGSKDLGVVPLEPLFIEKVDLGNPSDGSVSIHQEYENLRFYGITNATLFDSDADFTGDNCRWKFKTITGAVTMEADYKMTGKLLVFPINGHGKCKNVLYEVFSEYDVKCERFTKKNKKYLRITDFGFKVKPKRVVFGFDNIIDGNEQLSKEVVKTLNENALSVYADVGKAFDEVIAKIWKQTINQVFSRVPEDELFLP